MVGSFSVFSTPDSMLPSSCIKKFIWIGIPLQHSRLVSGVLSAVCIFTTVPWTKFYFFINRLRQHCQLYILAGNNLVLCSISINWVVTCRYMIRWYVWYFVKLFLQISLLLCLLVWMYPYFLVIIIFTCNIVIGHTKHCMNLN